MRLIDADALIEIIRKYGVYGSGFSDEERVNNVIDTIESQPTIEAVPVAHGEWIAQDEGLTKFKCSRCASPNYGGHEQFCPACGADMRKKV